MTEGFQQKTWQDFYEQAWQLRLNFMNAEIAKGETQPLRIIQKLHHHQRTHQVEKNPKTNTVEFQQKSDLPKTQNNIHENAQGISIGATDKSLPGTALQEWHSMGDSHFSVPHYMQLDKTSFLIDLMEQLNPMALVELGAGYGQNLIELYYNGGPDIPYYAGEFTKSGVEAINKLSSLDAKLNLQGFSFDHTNPDLSFLPKLDSILIFTCHSLEQVQQVPVELLKCLAQAAPKVWVLHMEPFGFQMAQAQNQYTELDRIQQKAFEEKGWNHLISHFQLFPVCGFCLLEITRFKLVMSVVNLITCAKSLPSALK
ncbi:MAG: hypothetical protein H7A33_07370 [Deltaproteobacteria bacterium]|nr:hypothetical protein [Deltaproteobacteria bacterium]